MSTTSKATGLALIMLPLGLVAGSTTFADARFAHAGGNSRVDRHIATHKSQEARIHFPGGLTATAPKPQSKPGDTGRPAPNLGSDGSGSAASTTASNGAGSRPGNGGRDTGACSRDGDQSFQPIVITRSR